MYKDHAALIQILMTNLEDIRNVRNLNLRLNASVRFDLNGKQFDVSGASPVFCVHEVGRSTLFTSSAAYEIERQLNGYQAVNWAHTAKRLLDVMKRHVANMDETSVIAYNEDCGGPDFDDIDTQRSWLQEYFISKCDNISGILEIVELVEGKKRQAELNDSIKNAFSTDNKEAK